MSKKKTDMEMREIAERIKEMVKDWDKDDFDDEAETEDKENYHNNNCEDCEYLDDECDCCDGDCEYCKYWNWGELCCELNNETEGEDCEEEEEEEEHAQTDNLSKFIMSVNTVLGGNMGLLVFDKSNKKDMEKIAAIFGEYAKRL